MTAPPPVSSDKLSVVDILLCIFCGPIACIIGIIRIIQGRTTNGLLMIVLPFVIGFVISLLQMLLMPNFIVVPNPAVNP